MTIHSYVEALLKYAEEYLLLDTLDENYIRENAYSLLGLSKKDAVIDVDVEDLEDMSSPALIMDNILAYAVERDISTYDDIENFKARFLDCFTKRPSELQEIFTSLAAKNAGKAISWIHDYNIKNGYIADFVKKWEARSTKGKLEVCFLPNDKSEECKFCHTVEGHGVHRNLRVVPFDLDGKEWYYMPCKYPKFVGHGNLVLPEHKALTLDEEALTAMTKFVDAAPNHFAAYKNCECQKKHGHITVGEKLLPIMKADLLTQLKSKEYPYITLWLVDWYIPTIRMSCTTRDKLVEFVLKTAKSWGLPYGVTVRKHDNLYIIDLVLSGDKQVSAGNGMLTGGKINFAAMLGACALTAEVYEDSLKIEKLLTKELNLKTAGNLDKYAPMIQRLMKEAGTAKLSPIEAALDVKEIINVTLENALKDIAVFPVGSNELLDLFDDKLNIKVHI